MFKQFLILGVVFATVLSSPPKIGFRQLTDTNYIISTEQATFLQAWASCQNSGNRFASILSLRENQRISIILQEMGVAATTPFWVGGLLLKSGSVSKWYWANGDDYVYQNFNSAVLPVSTTNNCTDKKIHVLQINGIICGTRVRDMDMMA